MATKLLFQHLDNLLEEFAILMATKVLFYHIVILLEEFAILMATKLLFAMYIHFSTFLLSCVI